MTIVSVSQITASLREMFSELGDLSITGELASYTHHQRSGHRYFTLKDEGASLQGVLWKFAIAKLCPNCRYASGCRGPT
ncbi:MAG: exodeoxyribonuclease VII large subunit [Synechococcaceae cyanobacterium SM2_3_60]|nr:exodeoxyribonuclease VII large subunit [Synechococcaceae cyanobacterium SM2_3_60]